MFINLCLCGVVFPTSARQWKLWSGSPTRVMSLQWSTHQRGTLEHQIWTLRRAPAPGMGAWGTSMSLASACLVRREPQETDRRIWRMRKCLFLYVTGIIWIKPWLLDLTTAVQAFTKCNDWPDEGAVGKVTQPYVNATSAVEDSICYYILFEYLWHSRVCFT